MSYGTTPNPGVDRVGTVFEAEAQIAQGRAALADMVAVSAKLAEVANEMRRAAESADPAAVCPAAVNKCASMVASIGMALNHAADFVKGACRLVPAAAHARSLTQPAPSGK